MTIVIAVRIQVGLSNCAFTLVGLQSLYGLPSILLRVQSVRGTVKFQYQANSDGRIQNCTYMDMYQILPTIIRTVNPVRARSSL